METMDRPSRRGVISASHWGVLAYALVVSSAFNGSLGSVLGWFSFRPDWFVSAGAALVLMVTAPWAPAGAWKRDLRSPLAIGLVAFVIIHLVASVVNAGRWPSALKFMNVYVLGLATFLVLVRGIRSRRALGVAVRLLIGVAVLASVWGGLAAMVSNWSQRPIAGAFPILFLDRTLIYAGQAGLLEPNILGSFLLAPFALSLWYWSDEPSSRFPFREAALLIVFGLLASQTRAVWLGAAAIGLVWVWLRRPRLARLSALVGMTVLSALLYQASLSLGRSAVPPATPPPDTVALTPPPAPSPGATGPDVLQLRVVNPLLRGRDYNLLARWHVNEAVFTHWLASGPVGWVLGNGSGSTNRIDFVLDIDGRQKRLERMWTGNVFLHTLHDAGLVGLVGLGVLLAAVAVELRSLRRRSRDRQDRGRSQALIVSAVSLLFAYQFTHALWQMSTYVFLGLVVVSSRVLDADTVATS
jgi:hypothetical protein